MTEYIDKIKLIEAIRTYQHNDEKDKIGTLMLIEMQPTADVAPVKHGKWIDLRKDDMDFEFKCSICGEVVGMADEDTTPHDVGFCYCPNCGAKMDLEG